MQRNGREPRTPRGERGEYAWMEKWNEYGRIERCIVFHIVFHICWCVLFSRWLTADVDSRNRRLEWRNGVNMGP